MMGQMGLDGAKSLGALPGRMSSRRRLDKRKERRARRAGEERGGRWCRGEQDSLAPKGVVPPFLNMVLYNNKKLLAALGGYQRHDGKT